MRVAGFAELVGLGGGGEREDPVDADGQQAVGGEAGVGGEPGPEPAVVAGEGDAQFEGPGVGDGDDAVGGAAAQVDGGLQDVVAGASNTAAMPCGATARTRSVRPAPRARRAPGTKSPASCP